MRKKFLEPNQIICKDFDRKIWKCPVCGAVRGDGGIQFKNTKYDGDYCINCWAKWFHENIPEYDEQAN